MPWQHVPPRLQLAFPYHCTVEAAASARSKFLHVVLCTRADSSGLLHVEAEKQVEHFGSRGYGRSLENERLFGCYRAAAATCLETRDLGRLAGFSFQALLAADWRLLQDRGLEPAPTSQALLQALALNRKRSNATRCFPKIAPLQSRVA